MLIRPLQPTRLSRPLRAVFLMILMALSGVGRAHAAAGQVPEVMVRAICQVSHGKLQAQYWTDQATNDRLIQLYGDPQLAAAFTNHVLREINASLASLNPLVKWHNDDGQTQARDLLVREKISEAADFTGPLADWLETYLTNRAVAGKFFLWHPTRPAKLEEESAGSSDVKMADLGQVLNENTSSLIAHIRQDEVRGADYRNGIIRIWFKRASPVEDVKLAGMDWPEALGKFKPGGYDEQKSLFETELKHSIASGGPAMAWNEDVGVQRLMTVLRARGLWEGISQDGMLTRRGAVYWLTFSADGREASVHLPHLSHIIFQGAADTDPVIRKVTRELLSADEYRLVCDSILENANRGSNCFLKGILSSRNPEVAQGRFVDLFALASYRARIAGETGWVTNGACITVTNRPGISFPPAPVKQAWLEPRLQRIRDMGWIASASATLQDENRLVDSHNRRRQELLHGGMDLIISPPRPKTTNAPANASVTATNSSTFEHWLTRKVHYRVEAGARWEDGEKIDWIARLSASHQETFGSLDTEFRYQNRLSAKVTWKPAEAESAALPSFLSVFTDTGTKRKVDGQEIEPERNGISAGKQVRLGDPNWNPVLNGAVELAHVKDKAGYVPSADEVRLPLAFSLYSEPDIWDAREHWYFRLSATPAARWGSATDFFTTLGLSGQARIPRGSHDFVSRVEIRSAAGPTPADALPYLGGTEGVRGVRPYSVPADRCIIARNELWWQVPFIDRSVSSDQHWYALAYENFRIASFVDAGWASGIHEIRPTGPWFVSPGIGLRLVVARNTYVTFDYAYGICRPTDLGGHRFSIGITTAQN
jgi:hypothetical protein